MTFRVARVTVEYNYGWECAACEAACDAEEKRSGRPGSSDIQWFDSGYSDARRAGDAARDHNRKRHGKRRAKG